MTDQTSRRLDSGPTRLVLALGVSLTVVAVAGVTLLAGLGLIGSRTAQPTTSVAQVPSRVLPTTVTRPALLTAPATSEPPITGSPTPQPGTSNVYVEYIVDASGSMTETLPGGTTKLAVAKDLLKTHLAAFRPETNIGLRAYGHRLPYENDVEKSCQDIELIAAPKPGNLETIPIWLSTFQAQGMTPMASSLQQALADFTFEPGRSNSVVLLSDGIETCGGDPCKLVQDLKARAVNFTIHVIGLNVNDPTRQQLQCVATAAGGTYHDAKTELDLSEALATIKQDVTKNEVITAVGAQTLMPASPPPSATSVAQPSPGGGRIAFNREHDGRMNIYTANVDGTNEVQLTSDRTANLMPAWSPDGTQIAFWSYENGEYGIYLMQADGSQQRRLARACYQCNGALVPLAWSPDGKRILFADGQEGKESLQGIDLNGNPLSFALPQIQDGTRTSVSWAPDGQSMAWAGRQRSEKGIFAGDANGTGRLLLADASRHLYLAWSPDGKSIAFNSERDGNYDIYVVTADGRDLRRLTQNLGMDLMPAWSPDSTTIIYSAEVNNTVAIYKVSSLGGTAEPLFVSSEPGASYASWTSGGATGPTNAPVIPNPTTPITTALPGSGPSPDARTTRAAVASVLLYNSERTKSFVRHDLEGDRSVTEAEGWQVLGFQLSPDGSRVAWGTTDGGWHLTTIGRETDSPIAIGHASGAPVWSPDSNLLYRFDLLTNQAGIVDRLGKTRPLVFDAGKEPRWSANSKMLAFIKDGALYVAQIDGQPRQVANGIEAFSWSPSELLLAYTLSGGKKGDSDQEIGRSTSVLDVASGRTYLAAQAGGIHSWAPDGRRLAIVRLDMAGASGSGFTILASDPFAGKLTELGATHTDQFASSSPARDAWIIGAWEVQPDTSGVRTIVNFGVPGSWTLDGNHALIVKGTWFDNARELYYWERRSGSQRLLFTQRGMLPHAANPGLSAIVSPGGKWAAVELTDRDYKKQTLLLATAGGTPMTLTHIQPASFSPDERWLIGKDDSDVWRLIDTLTGFDQALTLPKAQEPVWLP